MSMTDPARGATDPGRGTATAASSTEVRGQASESFARHRRDFRETKPSFMTTELWATIAGVVLLAVVYNVADESSFNLWRTCLLATVLTAAYVVSRGFAKSGSHDDKWVEDDRSSRRY